MSIFGNFAENLAFQGAMNHALSEADPSLAAVRVRATLDSIDPSNLSSHEKTVLLSVTHDLAADGELSASDADVITGLVSSYASSSRLADTLSGGNLFGFHDGASILGYTPSPMARLAMANPFNPLFGGVLGFLVDKVVQAFRDALFLGSGQGMLATCDGCANQQRVADALGDANLAKLNPHERARVLTMIGFASLDGHISRAESNAIVHYLDRAQGIVPKSTPQWTVQQNGGQAHIDLGNYTLDLNEGNSQFLLTNKETGETTRIWGDPHMEVDGKAVGDFYGTTTLNLDDGTKITIDTTPYAAGNGMTLSTNLTITQGNQAIVVTGLDQNTLGDLEISRTSIGGQLFDALKDDGVEIYENPEGAGWLRLGDAGGLEAVDRAFLASIR